MNAVRALFSEAIRDLGYAHFDAASLRSSLLATPRQAARFWVCDYYKGDPWKYLPRSWPADDPVMTQMSRMSAPIDYLACLRKAPKTASVLLQRGVLKTQGVRKAWLIPCNTLARLRWVTVYALEKREDIEDFFHETRDALLAMALPLVDRLDALHEQSKPAEAVAVVEKIAVQLTEHEHACLGRLAQGLTNAQIAAELEVVESTVRFHLKKVYRKIGVSNRAEATAFAVEHGFVLDHS